MPPRKDIAGQRFGGLVALKPAGKDSHGNMMWLCKCDCGNEHVVRYNALVQHRTQSCGCARRNSLIGQRFGELTVLEKIGKDSWLCKCDCGNTVVLSRSQLAYRTSCKQCKLRNGFTVRKDITGLRFGLLTALYPVARDKSGGQMWLCKCDCGNEKTVARRSLVSGATKSCGNHVRISN